MRSDTVADPHKRPPFDHAMPASSSRRSGWSKIAATTFALSAALIGFILARSLAARQAAALPPTSAKPAIRSTPPSASTWDERWNALSTQPNTTALTREREALLETLARTDPQRALSLADAEGNWLTRDQLRDASLRGWAAVEPDAAADWAMQQTVLGERMKCVAAVLAGATAQPDAALRVGLRLCTADPEPAGFYGHMLINALVERTGNFDAATRFATSANMIDRQSFLLDSAFYQWAQHDPDRAYAQLASLTDPTIRTSALKGLIEGRSDFDPRHFADFAQKLPAGADRTQALSISLQRWAGKDPVAALQWINRGDPDPDFDPGIAALAVSETLIAARPEVAMELTDNISDTTKRILTKSRVFLDWAQRDPIAARRYAEAVEHPATRETLLEDLKSLPTGAGKSKS
ncbi:hypothetical protein CMV30_13210 [Nibricoccus aquaticus]|uniref:Uncharacterized protein n=1 Tax=Nibricoccus aquaticus TaxID=2576891 RepID=A0A290Q9C6_9BACT|nr:hypothetical protein [Nibricoccus aquaticus]ATC64847.1 hypothetical protein CMV30_13210 [Nibricoccus aquaticus]